MRDLSRSELDWTTEQVDQFDASSFVDRHSAFEGTFRSQRDIRIEGEFKGSVSCDGLVFVAEGAVVAATIEAEHVTVAGDLSGEMRCRGRLQILPSGKVRARVATSSLVIQEGAVYEGQLEMAGVERSAPRSIRTRTEPTVARLEPGQPERTAGSGTTFIRRLGGQEAPWDGGETSQQSSANEEDQSTDPAG